MRILVLQICDPIINTLSKISKNAKCISTYYFSTLPTKLPHNEILEVLVKLIDFVFKEVTKLSLKLKEKLFGVK